MKACRQWGEDWVPFKDGWEATGDIGCLNVGSQAPFVTAGFMPWHWAAPVGWVWGADYKAIGSCFLIADDWIATAGHVIQSQDEAATRVVTFNHLVDSAPHQRCSVTLMPENDGFVRHYTQIGDLDFCFVRLRPRPFGEPPPGKTWGHFRLSASKEVADGTDVVMIHHPQRPDPTSLRNASRTTSYKCYSEGKMYRYDGRMRAHSACGESASSGAPLIAGDGSIVGIHYGEGGPNGLWLSTTITKIRECLSCQLLTPEQASVLGW